MIVLLLDTLRQSDINLMPNLTKLSNNGIKYTNAISPGTWTVTSHASIFTNKNVSKISSLPKNLFNNGSNKIDPWLVKTKFLNNKEETLAKKLKKRNYTNVLFSSNPFLSSYTNLTMGFDIIFDIWKYSNIKYNPKKVEHLLKYVNVDLKARLKFFKIIQYIALFLPSYVLNKLYLSLRLKLINSASDIDGTYKLDRGITDINKEIENYLKYNYNFNPHFIFANFIEAHENYPIESYLIQDKWLYMSNIKEMDDYIITKLHNAYIKRIKYLDKKIKNSIEIFRKYGLLNNAKLIITSDHGQLFGEHNLLYHSVWPYQNEVNVPLIILNYANGKLVKEKQNIDKLVSIKNIHNLILNNEPIDSSKYNKQPIISEHTGIVEGWDEKLLRILKSKSNAVSKIYNAKQLNNMKATAVYKNDLKLIHFFGNKKDELYNIKIDKLELDNIIDKNRYIANNMLNILNY